MPTNIARRKFLAQSTAVLAGTAVLGHQNVFAADSEPLFQISLAQWSLHRSIRKKRIDNLDFAAVTKREFGLDAVEYVNQFFFDKASDTSYLGEMKKRAADEGVKSLLIMVDREGRLGDPDDIAAMIQWLLLGDSSWVTGQIFSVDGGLSSVLPRYRVRR